MTYSNAKLLFSLGLGITLTAFTAGNANADDVAELVEPCAGCHGENGVSTEPEIPIISGSSAFYITDTMIAYSNEERPCKEVKINAGPDKGELDDMCTIAKDLDEDEIKRIAEYFAAKPFVRAKQDFDENKAKLGKEVHETQCKKCHEDGGSSPADDSGILAGQWIPYIREQLKDYSSGDRPMTKKMEKKYKELSDEDIENIIHYFASFQ